MVAAGTAADGAVAVVGPSLGRTPGRAVDDLAARLAQQGIDAPGPFAATAYDAGTRWRRLWSGACRSGIQQRRPARDVSGRWITCHSLASPAR